MTENELKPLMYNHRIVPENAPTCVCDCFPHAETCFHKSDTIPITSEWTAAELKALAEITTSEWNDIGMAWLRHSLAGRTLMIGFAQFLHDLLSLVPLKGLTIKQIKELKK